jgi:Glyoxalase-like domain
MTVRVGALVVGTADPQRAAAWYRAALDLPAGPVNAGGITLRFAPSAALQPRPVEPHRLIPNFLVTDARVVETRLVTLGAVWLREPEQLSCETTIGTVFDVDGNLVQFIQPAPEQPARPG